MSPFIRILSCLGIAGALTALGTTTAAGQSLGAAESFSVLGGSTVTSTGPTTIIGNLGVSPGTAITGFPPGSLTSGLIYTGTDSLAVSAHAAALAAYGSIATQLGGIDLSGVDLGGLTLTPGVYYFSAAAQLTGALRLNTLGDANAAFHFQIGSTLTTSALSSITLMGLGGGSNSNIFWQVGSSATLGLDTAFMGNILANASITLTTGATITNGRALAINGAVTLDSNTISNSPGVSAFWKGGAGNLWSQANWSTTIAGADNTNLLAANADVVFSTNAAARQSTVLDASASIASLTVNDSTPVSISGTHTLTLTGALGTTGITINSGAGRTDIATDIVLAGASQTITVNNASGLTISGSISGSIGLTKAGAGQATLSGTNTYTSASAITGGTLIAANPTALSSGSVSISALAFLKVGDGPTSLELHLSGALSGTGTVQLDIFSNGGGANPASAADRLIFTGVDRPISLSGTLAINNFNNLAAANFQNGDSFRLLDWGSISTGNRDVSALSFDFTQFDGVNFDVRSPTDLANFLSTGFITIVPEPSRLLLAGAGIVAALFRRKR